MSVFVFCVNLSHTTLCRLLFVISVYFTLYVLLLFVFSHIKALCGLALCGLQSNRPKGHGRLECSCVL